MDKRKLIRIIEKELEELKIIAEEVSENEKKDTGLIIEIALGKARVLCSEIELLRALNADENVALPLEKEAEPTDAEEASDVNISDPELEITDGEDDDENISFSPDEFDEDDAIDNELDDDLTEEEEEEEEEELDEEEEADGEDNDELLEFETGTELADDDEETPEPEEEEEEEEEDEKTEYQINPQNGFHEINIDDIGEEPELVQAQPVEKAPERPVIREIPKPEELIDDKKVTAETAQKPTLNETIGETKTAETTLKTGPITSLRAAIGLNDRFLFVREIFGNNTEKYNKIIDQLDKLETIQQAVDYLKSQLTLQKNETSLKFVELLKRRFTK